MTNERRKNIYTTIKIPKALTDKIDEFINNNPQYTSRTDVIKESLRNYLREQQNPQQKTTKKHPF